jgi:hypothetical protein
MIIGVPSCTTTLYRLDFLDEILAPTITRRRDLCVVETGLR